MVPVERQKEIIALLENRKHMTVAELAAALYVSEPTIRRDLAAMEKDGSIIRSRGGANYVYKHTMQMPLNFRNKTNIDEKLHIAKIAATLIEPGDIISMDTGSTGYCLAQVLPDDISLTVITYGIATGRIMAGKNFRVELPGGSYNYQRDCIYGEEAVRFINNRYSKICFISANGLDAERGLTDYSPEEYYLKRALLTHSDLIVVLIDHTKVSKSFYLLDAALSEIDIIITDKPLPVELMEACKKNLVDVMY